MMPRVVFAVLVLLLLFSCKEDEKFAEPDNLLRRWAAAAKQFNYPEYAKIEAYPKEPGPFRESFRDYYPSDLTVTGIEDADPKKTFSDHQGRKYNKRNAAFSFVQIDRKTGSSLGFVSGDVDFIIYLDPPDKKRGWLMLNRTMVHLNK